MKALFITLSLLFTAIAGTVYAAGEKDSKVSEVRKVEGFSSIKVTSVATVYFTQSDTYSLKIEGSEEYVTTTTTEVKGDRLIIGYKNKANGNKSRNQSVNIWISAPDLKEVTFTGVGSFNCEEPLKVDDLKFQISGVGQANVEDLTCNTLKVSMSGVGKADIHVNCDYLRASMSGVGSLTLSGKAKQADISKGGIGSVNSRRLKIGE